MKKIAVSIIAFVMLFAFVPAVPVYAQDVQVTIDGRLVDFPAQRPVTQGGRTLVPVRGVFDALGFALGWNEATRQVTLTNESYTVVITIGSSEFTTNGVSHFLDVPAQTIAGSTMIPIGAVLRSVGLDLSWDEGTSTVHIAAQGQPAPGPSIPGDFPRHALYFGGYVMAENAEYLGRFRMTDETIFGPFDIRNFLGSNVDIPLFHAASGAVLYFDHEPGDTALTEFGFGYDGLGFFNIGSRSIRFNLEGDVIGYEFVADHAVGLESSVFVGATDDGMHRFALSYENMPDGIYFIFTPEEFSRDDIRLSVLVIVGDDPTIYFNRMIVPVD